VDAGSNLAITGPTAAGSTATMSAPAIAPGETVATYAAALQAAVTTSGIAGVTVTAVGGKLSIVGTGITTAGSVIQDPVASANATGALIFNSSGNLVSPATNVAGVSFAGLADGASTLNMTWDLLGPSGTPTISQVDATSSVSATSQNGYGSGEYQSFAIGSDGTVTATFSNGQKLNVGQLALANVANLQGLQDLGDSEFATTLASGVAAVGVSGTNGLGTLQGGSVEESNVNISAEFSDLIIAQRGFEANAKAVTTFDTITQETINMIH
jgi:flagellar hook protein FlgE